MILEDKIDKYLILSKETIIWT